MLLRMNRMTLDYTEELFGHRIARDVYAVNDRLGYMRILETGHPRVCGIVVTRTLVQARDKSCYWILRFFLGFYEFAQFIIIRSLCF